MKLIIIEGGDRLGKSTVIKGLCEHFNYDNVTIRHFGKPPKDLTPAEVLDFQFKCFANEAELLHEFKRKFTWTRYNYYENVVIWNRAHLGEYVYSQMFREGNPKQLKDKLIQYENQYLKDGSIEVYLILLTAQPEFFHSKEDGNSFSQKLEDKTRELELFKEAIAFSTIKEKFITNVDDLNGKFRGKPEILNEVIDFIENKRTIIKNY